MNLLYNDLYNEILSHCDKNTKYNLKLVSKKFYSLIKDKIYDNSLDYWQHLIIELETYHDIKDNNDIKDNTYIPIIYRVFNLDEHFIIACGLLLEDNKCYEMIKETKHMKITNMKLEIDSKYTDDLFQIKIETRQGMTECVFSVNKILDIIELYDIEICQNIIRGLYILFNKCDHCDRFMENIFHHYAYGGNASIEIEDNLYETRFHDCHKVMEPFDKSEFDKNDPFKIEEFLWDPERFLYNVKLLSKYSNIHLANANIDSKGGL